MIPTTAPRRLTLPAFAPPPSRTGFPLMATLAPVAMSLAIWAVTRSPYSLLFAALGPVVALGGLLDGRRQRRRAERRQTAKALASIERLSQRVADTQRAERARLAALAPAPAVLGDPALAMKRWTRESEDAADRDDQLPLPVLLGRATLPAVVDLEGEPEEDEPPPPLARALERLRADAEGLAGAPWVVDARDGVAVLGPERLARAVARSLALQLAAGRSPATTRITAPRDEPWTAGLPHAVTFHDERSYRFECDGNEVAAVGWADDPRELPVAGRLAVQLDLSGERLPVALHGATGEPQYEALGGARAAELAAAVDAMARARGLDAAARSLPELVLLAELPEQSYGEPDGSTLRAALGRDADGAVELDLVRDGPHAIVAGTTGTGKSELLVSWVLAMAGRYPVEAVTFLLVDFKGGAAFAPLAGLPHVVGTVSDLDARRSRRAIESLRAELLRRERLLAEHGARAIDDLDPGVLARLVIVVDEFAAVVSGQPELHEVFADLAGRGRSLGLHLILCTQRPSGVVRDAVLANVTLRLSLRVTDRGDSLAMLGSDAAARLPPEPRGRALIADGSGPTRELQLALADRADAERVCAAWAGAGRATRAAAVWCEPLPTRLPLDSLRPDGAAEGDDPGIPFGRIDLPAEQRQPIARYDPDRDGHLLVLGAAGSGKTSLLATLAAGSNCRVLPADPADAWGALGEMLGPPATEPAPNARTLVLIDDLDALIDRLDPELRHDFVDMIGRIAREARTVAFAATAQRLSGGVQRLAGLFDERILLRQSNRDEHVLAGGDGHSFDPRMPPGAGRWRGADIQVAIGAAALPAPSGPRIPIVRASAAPLAVVAARPREVGRRLESAGIRVVRIGDDPAPDESELRVSRGGGALVLLGDPDAWQAEWALLGLVRRELPVLLLGCTAAELRAVTRVRDVPPPLGNGLDEGWLVDGGSVRRARVEP
ncbi:FtsK/SpoIIIE domain-containing protein [Lysinimonas soli]|uniref:FtsK/SpoIIIE domain-containing protein n=1 Tax=Lysinimonas soli TaxID=1074233 RepID=A0ABW0NMM6_9MICO